MNINQISQQDLTDYIYELADTFKVRFGCPVFSQDNPCWKPYRDYVFKIAGLDFYIATRAYWNEHYCFNDTGLDTSVDNSCM